MNDTAINRKNDINNTEVKKILLRISSRLSTIYNLQKEINKKDFTRAVYYKNNYVNRNNRTYANKDGSIVIDANSVDNRVDIFNIFNRLVINPYTLVGMQFNRKDLLTVLSLYKNMPLKFKLTDCRLDRSPTAFTAKVVFPPDLTLITTLLTMFTNAFLFSTLENPYIYKNTIQLDNNAYMEYIFRTNSNNQRMFNFEGYIEGHNCNCDIGTVELRRTIINNKKNIIDEIKRVGGDNLLESIRPNIQNIQDTNLNILKTLYEGISDPKQLQLDASINITESFTYSKAYNFSNFIEQKYGSFPEGLQEFAKEIVSTALQEERQIIVNASKIIFDNPSSFQTWKKFFIFNKHIENFLKTPRFDFIRNIYGKILSFNDIKYKIRPFISRYSNMDIDQDGEKMLILKVGLMADVYLKTDKINIHKEHYEEELRESILSLTNWNVSIKTVIDPPKRYFKDQGDNSEYYKVRVFITNFDINILDYINKESETVSWEKLKKAVSKEIESIIKQEIVMDNTIPLAIGLGLDYKDILKYIKKQINEKSMQML